MRQIMCSNDDIIENYVFSTPNRCARIIDSSYDSETCNGSIFFTNIADYDSLNYHALLAQSLRD
jgi:hypothetical protein